jgi:hypothetical protein
VAHARPLMAVPSLMLGGGIVGFINYDF